MKSKLTPKLLTLVVLVMIAGVQSAICQEQTITTVDTIQHAAHTFALSSLATADVGHVALGDIHTCFLNQAGEVFCWGSNYEGRLGNGMWQDGEYPYPAPIAVSGVTFAALTSGSDHTCALTDTGAVMCWGSGFYGELGVGGVTFTGNPQYVTALGDDVRGVSAGGEHTCAVTDVGGVECWGHNLYGEVGDGTTSIRLAPVAVTGLESGIQKVVAGWSNTCAITDEGGVVCWGRNTSGQLGNGTTIDSAVPVSVTGLSSGARALAVGRYHTCAVMTSGSVKCWGSGDYCGVEVSIGTKLLIPTDVPSLPSGVSDIAAGAAHTCALLDSGEIRCWGSNANHRLGLGPDAPDFVKVPGSVAGLPRPAAAISTGLGHTCAVLSTGNVVCWGANNRGQLGDGQQGFSSVSGAVLGLEGSVQGMAVGDDHTCVALDTGRFNCWGRNNWGQLGTGTVEAQLLPVDVSVLSTSMEDISPGPSRTCVLKEGGAACWGYGEQGQLGNGSAVFGSLYPVDVAGVESQILMLAAGQKHACALVDSGRVQCWGDNSYGQLGDGSTTSSLTPVDVSGLRPDTVQVEAGRMHTCAIDGNGGVQCWGYNSHGQLGDGGTTTQVHPVDVVGLQSGVKAVSAGYAHTCALMASGGVKCWGDNGWGSLGDGSVSDSYDPVDVTGLGSGMRSVSAGGYHTCAVTEAGGALCWGYNYFGQLGNGAISYSRVPTDVLSHNSGVQVLVAGDYHTCVLTESHEVACWGDNRYNQLGNGELSYSPLPVLVALGAQFFASGRVTTAGGIPISAVSVDASSGGRAFSDLDGQYTVTSLLTGTYVLTPTLAGWAFDPPTRSVTVPPNRTAIDFEGHPDIALPEGAVASLQLHLAEALPPGADVVPATTIIYVGTDSASFGVRFQLWAGFELVSERYVSVSFLGPGSATLTADFGLQGVGHYYVWVDLLKDGQRVDSAIRSFRLGIDFWELHSTIETLEADAYEEILTGERMAAYALAQTTLRTENYVVESIIDPLLDFLALFLPGSGPVSREVTTTAIELLADQMDILDTISGRPSFDERFDAALAYQDETRLDAIRVQLMSSTRELLRFAETQAFIWSDDLESELLRREAALSNTVESEQLGFTVELRGGAATYASLQDMDNQFKQIENRLDQITLVSDLLKWLLIFLVLAAFLIVGFSVSLPAALTTLVTFMQTHFSVYLAVKTLYGVIANLTRSFIAGTLLTALSFSMVGTAQRVGVSVQDRYREALRFVRDEIVPDTLSDLAQDTFTAFRMTSRSAIEDMPGQCQLFRGDGRLMGFVDCDDADYLQAMHLPAGTYWLLPGKGTDPVAAAKTLIEVPSPQLAMSLTLSEHQLVVGESLDAVIVITNTDVVSATGDVLISLETIEDDVGRMWLASLAAGQTASYSMTFSPDHEGDYVVRASAGGLGSANAVWVDQAFSVGESAAVSLDLDIEPEYPPDQSLVWTLSAHNAGAVPTSTVATLSVLAYEPNLRAVFTSTTQLDLASGQRTLAALHLPQLVPGKYAWQLHLGGNLYAADNFLVQADGALFALVDTQPPYVGLTEEITLTVRVEDEAFAPIDASVQITLTHPDGTQTGIQADRFTAGAYTASYTATLSGTHYVDVTITRDNYASYFQRTYFVVGFPSRLEITTSVQPIVGGETPVEFIVLNELGIPVPDAALMISTTTIHVARQTSMNGTTVLSLRPVNSDAIPLQVSKMGYATTTLDIVPTRQEILLFLPLILR